MRYQFYSSLRPVRKIFLTGLSLTGLILFLIVPLAYAELENFQAADVVLGQPDFTQTTANNGGVSARSMSNPAGVFSDGKRLFYVDRSNHRLLIWSSIPATNFTSADVVLGQPNFTSNTANAGGSASARTLNNSRGVYSDGKKLFVADQDNNRVLIWNTIPTTNFTPADVVLGQPDFTQTTANNGGVSAKSLNVPRSVFTDGKKLFVADASNSRFLIWNTIPTTNFVPADVVLGQPDFNQNAANNGGVSARSLGNNMAGIYSDGQKLFVGEFANNRLLIWNAIPTTNFTPADMVLGQPDFNSNTANNGGVSARAFRGPLEFFSDGKRLFMPDQVNNRVLIWNHIPTTNFEPADIVLGQPDFNSNTANNGGVTAKSMTSPQGVFSNGKQLFITDRANNRVLIYNLSGSSLKPDPQFEQGKAVVGKVFNDINGNGIQDQDVGATPRVRPLEENSTLSAEKGIEGVKVVSDTGIYAITDQDGKYHFPFIETGQHVLKIDPGTLPEGATLTTDNPYKVTVTRGVLTKVSFGIQLPRDRHPDPERSEGEGSQSLDSSAQRSSPLGSPQNDKDAPFLQVSITQDSSSKPEKTLGITAEIIEDKIKFTTTCNYFLFIKESEIMLYDDQGKKPVIPIPLPHPIPLHFELPLSVIPPAYKALYYQLIVRDAQGHEDRTSVGSIELK